MSSRGVKYNKNEKFFLNVIIIREAFKKKTLKSLEIFQTGGHIVIGHQKGFDLTKYGELHPSLPALVVPGVGWVSWPVVRIDKLLTDKL